jgi:hypothetical protein
MTLFEIGLTSSFFYWLNISGVYSFLTIGFSSTIVGLTG